MTVKELKKLLKQFKDDDVVYVWEDREYEWLTPEAAWKEEDGIVRIGWEAPNE